MRYLLIDKIISLEIDKRIVALKNVTLSEDLFSDHFIGCPILPGAMMIESFAHAGTALLEVSSNYTIKALMIMVERAKFRKFVYPGDQLVIGMHVISSDGDSALLEGEMHVREDLVAETRIVFSKRDPEKIYTPKTRFLMETMYEVWLRDALITGGEGKK